LATYISLGGPQRLGRRPGRGSRSYSLLRRWIPLTQLGGAG